jgi:hypothetical protein
VASCINNAFEQRSGCYHQSREKEHWMDRNAEADCESHNNVAVVGLEL